MENIKNDVLLGASSEVSRLLRFSPQRQKRRSSPQQSSGVFAKSENKQSPPSVSVIIPGFNSEGDIVECLKSVLESSYPKDKLEIFFIDNNSKDNSIKLVRENFFKKIKIIKFKKNLGYAKAINTSLKWAKGDYLLILNADLKLDKNCLKELVETTLKSPKNAVVGPKVYEYDKKTTLQTIYGKINKQTLHVNRIASGQEDKGQCDKEKNVEYVAFCSSLVKKDALIDIGLLDENFFVYFEEVDFYLRLKAKNWKMVYCPKAKVWHKGGVTIGKNNFLITYYLTRNNLYLRNKLKRFSILEHLKNIRFLTTSFFLSTIKHDYFAVVLGIKDFYLNKFGPAPF